MAISYAIVVSFLYASSEVFFCAGLDGCLHLRFSKEIRITFLPVNIETKQPYFLRHFVGRDITYYINVVLVAELTLNMFFASWGFINALSHGSTIIGTGMKYFSKASKAII